MEVEFKKDLRHSYMVITKNDSLNPAQYCTGMLEHQAVDGILPFEQRRLDNQVYYYYEITAKQTMSNILERTSLSGTAFRQLFQGVMDIMERAYEYLLPEDDFMLSPEFIYLDIAKYNPHLCYLPGASKNIKKQMNSLLEYLMNKIDYTDKDAVFLVYQLYAVSREEEFTFDQLAEVLQKDLPMTVNDRTAQKQSVQKKENQAAEGLDISAEAGKQDFYRSAAEKENSTGKHKSIRNLYTTRNKVSTVNQDKSKNQDTSVLHATSGNQNSSGKLPVHDAKEYATEEDLLQHYPVMKEKIESETEALYYPIQNLILSGICILAGIMIAILGLTSGILYNSFGNRLDYTKLLALILVILCAESYAFNKLLDKKSKIAKVIKTCEYVDPRTNFEMKGIQSWRKPKAHISDDLGEDEVNGHRTSGILNSREGLDICEERNAEKETVQWRSYYPEKSIYTEKNQYSEKNQNLEKNQNIEMNQHPKAVLRETIDPPAKEMNSIGEKTMLSEKEAQREIRKLIKYQDELPEEEDYNPTCLLNSLTGKNANIILKAVDSINYNDILVSEFPFFIGKLHKNMNYRLDKDVVSRYHAKITLEDSRYYLTDLNSTNGTAVNGESLLPYQCKEFKTGDEIAFADIRYRVARY